MDVRSPVRVHDLGDAVDPEDSLHHLHGQNPGFGGVDVRADYESGVDIDHHVAVEVLASDRAGELGDIPGEHLARGCGHEFRNSPGRMFGQAAALLNLPVFLSTR
jgi:hypothetical protein